MMEKTNEEIDKVRRLASRLSFFLVVGLIGMLASLQEGSTPWAMWVGFTGLNGVAIGLLAGAGWSDHCLGRTADHRQTNPGWGFLISLLTFWGPCLLALVFGLVVANTLPDAVRPASSLEDKSFNIIFQSSAMYFNAIGCTWLIVWLDARRLASERLVSSDA